jgi:hypothetical protein
MNDKELEERKEEIKNSNSNIPICVVYDVDTKTKDFYLLKVVFNNKFANEKRIIKLKKSYFSKGNKLSGKTLTGKLYLLFKIKNYSDTEDERNIKLFLILKKIGVVTNDNEIDVNKFKGLVFQAGKNNSIRKITRNPNYILRYDYLFNGESPSVVNYHTKKMFNEKGYEKDYREFKKIDRKNVNELKKDVTQEQEQKVDKVINGFEHVIKDKYDGENTKTECYNLIGDFLTMTSRSKIGVKELSVQRLSTLFCSLIEQIGELKNEADKQNRRIDEQDRIIRKQNRIIDELKNKLRHLESCIEDRDVTIREYKERLEEQDRKIRKQDRRIKELENKLDRLENR